MLRCTALRSNFVALGDSEVVGVTLDDGAGAIVLGDLARVEFVARTDVGIDINGKEKNETRQAVTRDHKEYAAVMGAMMPFVSYLPAQPAYAAGYVAAHLRETIHEFSVALPRYSLITDM